MNISSLQPKVVASDIPPEQLAGNTTLTKQQKIAEASRQFEAVLLRQILEQTQKTVIHSKYTDESMANSIYRDQITSQLADSISKSGEFGLARTFQQQLTKPTDLDTATSAETKTSTPKTPAQHEHASASPKHFHSADAARSCSAYFQFPKP